MTESPASTKFATAFAPRILPGLDDANREFWTAGADGVLRIAHCGACGRYVHPPRGVCPDCRGGLKFRTVSGRGTVLTFTVAHQQFHPDVPTPFVIAVVELPEQEGLRLTTNLVGCDTDEVRSDMPVEVRFERHERGGSELFVPVFVPASLDQRVPR